MKKPTQFRQGDVLIEKVKEIPTTTKAKDNLLVIGEGRNHGHYATGNVEVLEKDGDKYLNAGEEFAIEHLLIDSGVWTKEHNPVTIPAGKYKVIQQQEYNPYEKAIQKVQD